MAKMNIKKESKPGVCAAMRCTEKTTDADTVRGPWDHDVELCGRHYGLAIADHGRGYVAHVAHLIPSTRYPDEPIRVGEPAHPSDLDRIVVVPAAELHAEPVALAAEGSEVLDFVRTFEIQSQDDLTFAADTLTEIKARARYVLERKEAITKPMNAALKAARDLFRPAEQHFAEAERIFKDAIASFHTRQEDHNRAALAAAAAAYVEGDDAGVSSAVASMASTANTAGIQIRHTWQFEIVDGAQVPRELCSPDPVKIRAWMNAQVAQARVDGIAEEEIFVHANGVHFARVAGVAVKS
jgi:hypothetical protein